MGGRGRMGRRGRMGERGGIERILGGNVATQCSLVWVKGAACAKKITYYAMSSFVEISVHKVDGEEERWDTYRRARLSLLPRSLLGFSMGKWPALSARSVSQKRR